MKANRLGLVARIATSVALVATLAACSTDGGSDGDKEEFTIGAFGSLTGPLAGWGTNMKQGAELALEDVNKSGDLDFDLKMVFEDDACNPADAQAVYRRLVDRQGVDMLYGSSCSATALAVADLAEEDEVVYLSPVGTARAVAVPAREHVFSTQVDSVSEANSLVSLAMKTYEPKDVGFMFTSSEYGIAAIDGAKAALKEQAPDVKIVAEAGFPEGTSEFTSGLIRLRDADPDVVFVVGAGSDLGPMIRSARDLGVDGELVGFSSLFTTETIRTAGDLLDNVTGFFYTPERAASDSDSEFLAGVMTRYKEKNGEWPDGLALQGYQGILVIAEALKNLDGEPSTENLIDAFESLKDFDTGIYKPMTFGEGNRQAVTEGVLMKLLPGREETTSLWGNFEILPE